MSKTLGDSAVDRKNILNNAFAVEHIRKEVGIRSIDFDKKSYLTLKQVASFFEVDERTIERYISDYASELRQNGYEILSGKKLQDFKANFGADINVGTKTTSLGVFNFKSFLNIGMLLRESENARTLRSLILDIAIDVVAVKSGGNPKYINQRDESYLYTLYSGEAYRKEFTDALKDYIDMGHIKYAIYTDKIYRSIFKEQARQYREMLKLSQKENIRDTMYSEILTTISMYETGLANDIKNESLRIGRKLSKEEVDKLFVRFESNPAWRPQVEMARIKMASRDYGFRDVLHTELENYITPIDSIEFERFLGEKSKQLAERVEEYKDVFKRLKDK